MQSFIERFQDFIFFEIKEIFPSNTVVKVDLQIIPVTSFTGRRLSNCEAEAVSGLKFDVYATVTEGNRSDAEISAVISSGSRAKPQAYHPAHRRERGPNSAGSLFFQASAIERPC